MADQHDTYTKMLQIFPLFDIQLNNPTDTILAFEYGKSSHFLASCFSLVEFLILFCIHADVYACGSGYCLEDFC